MSYRENIAEEYEHNGFLITIFYDNDPLNPRDREYQDRFGTLAVYPHRRYTLGDEEIDPEGIQEILKCKQNVVLPLYFYDHSVQAMSTRSFRGRAHHAEWDSGFCGIAYITREEWQAEHPEWKNLTKARRSKLEEYLDASVEEYSSYLQGEVYGYTISEVEYDEDGEMVEGKDLDSCWGFIGDIKYCKSEAEANADYYAKREAA